MRWRTPWTAAVLFVLAIASWFLSDLVGSGYARTVDDYVWSASFLAFPLVGLLIALRRPDHPLGWCWLLGVGLVGLSVNLSSIAEMALFPVPTAWWAGWMALASGVLTPIAIALLLFPATLWFPDGHLPSPRWRWVARLGIGAVGVYSFATLFKPTVVLAQGVVENPVRVGGAAWLEAVVPIAAVALALVGILGAISLIWRYRKAEGIERRQLKWIAFALIAAVLGLVFGLFADTIGVDGDWVGLVPWLIAGLGFPTAVAIAILRYRLYDIDKLISRTVSYAVVAAVLVAVYAGFALGLGSLIGRGNPLAVAGATLAAAALFNPVRRRVQAFIDRRFDRSRYDSARVVDEFGSRLREEIDLEGLVTDLSNVVGQTLRPASFRLWLRADGC